MRAKKLQIATMFIAKSVYKGAVFFVERELLLAFFGRAG